jgi:hypothetical protein
MHAKYPIINNDTERQEIKHVRKVMPDICASVFARAFGIEAVCLRHGARFVVTSDQLDSVWIAQFQAG